MSRLTHLETTEPQDVAALRSTVSKLRDDVGALADDLAALRTAHTTLQHAVDKAETREEHRREKAGERAERREQEERRKEVAHAERMGETATLIRELKEELRRAR